MRRNFEVRLRVGGGRCSPPGGRLRRMGTPAQPETERNAMPLVRIDLAEGTSPEYRAALADTVYRELVEVAGAPENDRFVIISEHKAENLFIDPHYINERTDAAVTIQIVFNSGRTLEVKKALYKAIATSLNIRLGVRTEDVIINLIDVPKENWSFGRGEAQYAD
jgi:4-oxalocrotonate tautomerase